MADLLRGNGHDRKMSVTSISGNHVTRDVTRDVTRIVTALQCNDPRCECKREKGGKFKVHCPAHADSTPSLSVTEAEDKVLVKCFGGCSQESVINALRDRGLWGGCADLTVKGVTPLHGPKGLTLKELADAKKLDLEWLKATFRLSDYHWGGAPAVKAPYFDLDGNVQAVRFRLSLSGSKRFVWRRGDRVVPYFDKAAFEDARRLGWVLIEEGESDFWTLRWYGLPAFAIPGKSTWRSEWAKLLDGLEVYLWQEPGAEDLAAAVGADIPHLRIIRAPEGIKDPSVAHVLGRDVPALLEELRRAAIPYGAIRRELEDAHLRELAALAAPVLQSADPLDLVDAEIVARGYGGDRRPVKIVYLAETSRVLAMRAGAMPVHVLLLGLPSTGKSYTVKLTLSLLPAEAHHEIDAGSPRALIYDKADLRHRVLVFGEADSLPASEDNPAASAIRNLLQDNELHYTVTVRDPETGAFTVQEIAKPGPTVLLTTAVKRLGDQLMSRFFALEMTDDPAQVSAALKTQAGIELAGTRAPDPALIAFQAYLQALAPWDVLVPFAGRLAEEISKAATAPRIQRDFSRLLALVKAVTVIRHQKRRTNEEGRLIAEIADYDAIRELCNDMFSDTVTEGATKKVREAVEAVKELYAGRATDETITAKKVAEKLGISRPAANRRLKTAIYRGWVVNTEQRKMYPWNLEPGETMPESSALPVLEDDFEACNAVTGVTVRYSEPLYVEPVFEEFEV